MGKIDQVVFIVDQGEIVESRIRDLNGYIELTTTPNGIAPKLHVRGTELWTWGHCGNFPHIISTHESEADAIEALEDSFAYDFWHSAFLVFNNRPDAETWILENE